MGAVIVAILLGIAAFVFGTWVAVWNVQDMIDYGVNFWNMFWLLLVVACVSGGVSKI